MKVSLCMIVKDCVRTLERAVASAAPLVDEICILDTGSTDGTVEVAQEWANVFASVEWQGFAHARNRVQEMATGDVILILDADEEITQYKGWEKAKELLAGESDAVAFLVHNHLPGEQLLLGDRLWQIRMFPNAPFAKWTGRVHNQITAALKDNPKDGVQARFHQVPVLVEHWGYALSPEELQAKYERRLPSLLEDLEDAAEDNLKAYYQFQTCNAYFMLKDRGKSLEYAEVCKLEHLTEENQYGLALLAVHAATVQEDFDKAHAWAEKMMEIWPGEIMSFLTLGLSLLQRREYRGAYNFLGSCMCLLQLQGMEYKYVIDAEYVAAAAGEAAFMLKRYGEAKELFQMHLRKYPGNERLAEVERNIVPIEQAQNLGIVGPDGQPVASSPGGSVLRFAVPEMEGARRSA